VRYLPHTVLACSVLSLALASQRRAEAHSLRTAFCFVLQASERLGQHPRQGAPPAPPAGQVRGPPGVVCGQEFINPYAIVGADCISESSLSTQEFDRRNSPHGGGIPKPAAISTLPFAFVRSRDRARARAHDTLGSGRGAGPAAPAAPHRPRRGFRTAGPCRWVRRRRRVRPGLCRLTLAAACGGWVRWRRICATYSPASGVDD